MTPVAPEQVALLALVGGVLVLAGLVKGALGFGPALVSVPVLVQVFDPKTAIAAFSIPLLVGNLVVLWRDGVSWAAVRPHLRLAVTVFLATVVGAVGLLALPADVLSLVVGVAVLGYLAATYRSGEALARYANHRWSAYVVGSATGVLGGALGMGGLPLATYLDARELDRDVFTLVLVLLLALNNSVRIAALWAGGLFTAAELALGGAFVVPVFLGVVVGVRLRRYISPSRFETLVRLVLLVSSVRLVSGALA
ncbi:MAG: sulfite exporter TauE/SafE family protein [Haloplanus sp.]